MQSVKCLVRHHHHHYYYFLYETVASECREGDGGTSVVLHIDTHIIRISQGLKIHMPVGTIVSWRAYDFLVWVPAEADPETQVEAKSVV